MRGFTCIGLPGAMGKAATVQQAQQLAKTTLLQNMSSSSFVNWDMQWHFPHQAVSLKKGKPSSQLGNPWMYSWLVLCHTGGRMMIFACQQSPRMMRRICEIGHVNRQRNKSHLRIVLPQHRCFRKMGLNC